MSPDTPFDALHDNAPAEPAQTAGPAQAAAPAAAGPAALAHATGNVVL